MSFLIRAAERLAAIVCGLVLADDITDFVAMLLIIYIFVRAADRDNDYRHP